MTATSTSTLILGLYFATLSLLAVYGVHRFVTVVSYYRNRRKRALSQPLPARLPRVTIQLPLYNEVYVTASTLMRKYGVAPRTPRRPDGKEPKRENTGSI